MDKLGASCVLLVALLFWTSTEAYDVLDPNGNITIRWDIKQWNPPDDYYAVVTIYNYQKYRHIQAPGWTLGWEWSEEEVIWAMFGAQATEQGDCSKFKLRNIPHCCKRDPSIVDLLPGTPYNQQSANCCKGGVLNSWVQDPNNHVTSFQISVGRLGTSNEAFQPPTKFTLKAPGPGYTCEETKEVPPSKFLSPDGRRATQAMQTWQSICTYSKFRAQRNPTCCVSLSTFYSDTITTCPTCSCGCQNNITERGSCVEGDSPNLAAVVNGSGKNTLTLLVQCTSHMCPIRVHWHVKHVYKEYWRVKVTITNLNYWMNYSQWNIVVQHLNFENLTRSFSFNYKRLTPYGAINDTGMLWGIKHYDDLLMEAGPGGYVQSDLLFRKDSSSFTLQAGWAFPRHIYFNGDSCVMPPPDAYPWLPNAKPTVKPRSLIPYAFFWACLAFLLVMTQYRYIKKLYHRVVSIRERGPRRWFSKL